MTHKQQHELLTRALTRHRHSVLCWLWSLAEAHGGYSVFAGVGERTREGNDLYKVSGHAQHGTAQLSTATIPPQAFTACPCSELSR